MNKDIYVHPDDYDGDGDLDAPDCTEQIIKVNKYLFWFELN